MTKEKIEENRKYLEEVAENIIDENSEEEVGKAFVAYLMKVDDATEEEAKESVEKSFAYLTLKDKEDEITVLENIVSLIKGWLEKLEDEL